MILALAVMAFGLGGVAWAGPSGDEPAVELVPEATIEEDSAWTFRFLIPTLLVMGALGVGLSVFIYVRNVKGRYRVAR